jgi:FkbM family methyltransferase
MKFYAEFNTDKILRDSYFSDTEYKGTFVEVGGATPDFLSMSKHFRESGWRTIVIEPNPNFSQMHRDVGNEIYEFACSYEDKDDVDFTVVKQDVITSSGVITDHSFSSLEVKDEYIKKTGFKLTDSNTKKIKVNVRKLQTILSEIKIEKVDILSIDVEGWELEVMKGIDTNLIKCRYIVLENLYDNISYSDYMTSIGFNLVQKIEYNHVYEFNNW